MLDDIAGDIATYYVFRSSRALLGPLPDDKRKDYYLDHTSEDPNSLGTLVLIRNKKIQFPEFTVISPSEAKSVRNRGRHPIFDIDAETSQGPSRQLLDDIAGERSE